MALLQSLAMIDSVVIGDNFELGLDFQDHFLRIRPDILAVTDDDQYGELKRALCSRTGASYVVLPKTPPKFRPVSTSRIVRWIRAPRGAPLRVDFAGGWLDVPRFSRAGGLVVNCAISPLVSINFWGKGRARRIGEAAPRPGRCTWGWQGGKEHRMQSASISELSQIADRNIVLPAAPRA